METKLSIPNDPLTITDFSDWIGVSDVGNRFFWEILAVRYTAEGHFLFSFGHYSAVFFNTIALTYQKNKIKNIKNLNI